MDRVTIEGYGFVVTAALLWGTAGIASTLAPAGIPAAAFADVRLWMGGCGLAWVLGPRRLRQVLIVKARRPLVVASGALALFQWSFFTAVASTGVAVATVVSTTTAPLMAGALAYACNRVPLSLAWWFAFVLTVIGLAFVGADAPRASLIGVFWALASGALYALFTQTITACEHVPGDDVAITAWALLAGAVALTPMAATYLEIFLSLRGMVVAVYLGWVTTALAYGLYILGLRRLGATAALAALWVQPLAGILFGFLVLHEVFNPRALVGVSCLALAMVGLTRAPRTPPARPPDA